MANTGEAAHRNEWSVLEQLFNKCSGGPTGPASSVIAGKQAHFGRKELEKELCENICQVFATQFMPPVVPIQDAMFKHCVRSWACFLCLVVGVFVLGARWKQLSWPEVM